MSMKTYLQMPLTCILLPHSLSVFLCLSPDGGSGGGAAQHWEDHRGPGPGRGASRVRSRLRNHAPVHRGAEAEGGRLRGERRRERGREAVDVLVLSEKVRRERSDEWFEKAAAL